jgi:hypothetical protein
MKTFWTTVFLATMLSGFALAQEGTAPPTRTAPLNGPTDTHDAIGCIESGSDEWSADRCGKRDPRGADEKHRRQEAEDGRRD